MSIITLKPFVLSTLKKEGIWEWGKEWCESLPGAPGQRLNASQTHSLFNPSDRDSQMKKVRVSHGNALGSNWFCRRPACSAIFNNLNDKRWMFCTGLLVAVFLFFFYVHKKHDMHQSRWRHSRRLLNADTLDGECIGVLESRSIALSVVGREAACQISGPAFSISAGLCFTHIRCHFCLYSFEVFSCAPHLDGEFPLHECVYGQKSRPGYFHTLHQPIKYWWRVHVPPR